MHSAQGSFQMKTRVHAHAVLLYGSFLNKSSNFYFTFHSSHGIIYICILGIKDSVAVMLTIGNVLLLEPRNTVDAQKYKCRLVERKGDMLYIDYPINIETHKTAFLLDGTQLKAVFVYGQSAYSFNTEITGRLKQTIPMMKLHFPGAEYVMKIQRRQFVRIETGVDVAIHPLNREFEPFTARTEDISAGGMLVQVRANTDLKLEQGMKIKTVIVLQMQSSEIHYLHLKSRIIRMNEKEQTNFFKYSIQFEEVSPFERQQLLRFTFERQLELKKKGLEYLE